MFDKYVLNPGGGSHSHYHKTEVTEKRAPTDESVKLLREMEQKILDNILDGFLITGNQLEVCGIYVDSDAFCKPRFHCAFKLNGRMFKLSVPEADYRHWVADPQEAIRALIRELGQAIAREIIGDPAAALEFTRWSRR